MQFLILLQVSRDYDEEEQLGYDGEEEKGRKKEKEEEDTKDKGEAVDMDISDSPWAVGSRNTFSGGND